MPQTTAEGKKHRSVTALNVIETRKRDKEIAEKRVAERALQQIQTVQTRRLNLREFFSSLILAYADLLPQEYEFSERMREAYEAPRSP